MYLTNNMTFNTKLMASLYVFLIFLTSFVLQITCSTREDFNEAKCPERERLALLNFKAGLINDDGMLSTWGAAREQRNCCEWNGVLCDNKTSHVVALDLRGDNYYHLIGKMSSSSLLELDELRYLDLSGNDFNESHIPESIHSLSKLQHLNLSFSNFAGTIPQGLGNLSMLRVVDLGNNWGLGGIHLEWLSELHSLEYLDLSGVRLYETKTWMQTISNLKMLKSLNLSNCGLLETDLFTSLPLTNTSASLAILDLSGNHKLTSTTSLANLDLSGNNNKETAASTLLEILNLSSSFRYIDLSNNRLQGGIPDAVGNLMTLSHLNLAGNYLQGNIPCALGNLISLSHLDLSYNALDQPSRGCFNLTNLRYLDLHHNNLKGQLSDVMLLLRKSTMLEFLNLSENQLSGLVPQISRFSFLKELRLQNNKLNGSFIERKLQLPGLELLDVSQNQITGSVPNLASCSSLRYLDLSYNIFRGTLTQSIGNLFALQYLYLDSNRLEGVITEAYLFNLSRLGTLHFSGNSNLTIKISSSWNPPFQLSELYLAHCKLGPYFPKWLQTQNRLSVLDISYTEIRDTIPEWFWDNARMLRAFDMSNNQIHGGIPDLSSKANLHVIYMDSNQLNGSLPLFSRNTTVIHLSRNNFVGEVSNFFNVTDWWITELDISNNLLSGALPTDCFMKMRRLEVLNLANNNFSGSIPSLIDSYCLLYSFHLRNNSFEGEIPNALRNCYTLRSIDMRDNKLTGKIPAWIGESFAGLAYLSLNSNKFYGTLPLSLCYLTNIRLLDISTNMISGSIPKCVNNFTMMMRKDPYPTGDTFGIGYGAVKIGYPENGEIMWKGTNYEYDDSIRLVKIIDLSSNNLVGEIPREITSLQGLFSLNLSRNNLAGSIPREISQLESLDSLDLSQNNLSGTIPDTLSQLHRLGVLNLSINNLSGRIPWIDHLLTFNESTYTGNPGLCGTPLLFKPCPEDELPKITIESGANVDDNYIITKGFYVSMAIGFVIAFCGVFGALLLVKSCWIMFSEVWMCIEDWLYVKILVNKRRLHMYFEK